MAALVCLTLALLGAAALEAPAARGASPGVEVYVGYADTLRSDPANFPTPWSGSPGVVFAGCTSSCSFDAGAVRIVNDSTTVQTVDSISVTLGTCTFAMWPNGTVLQPGQQFIITQTASGAASGCNNAAGYFDTSDIGPNGQSWSSCSQSGVVPVINATIDGVVNTFTDSKQVLNTGGVDLASCPPGTNESTQWSLIGSRCSGATLSLAPTTQTDQVGTEAKLNATLLNGCGDALQGATVAFTVPNGPDAGKTGSAVTDAGGNAAFTYKGTTPGTDTVQASTTNPAGTITSNTADVVWHKRISDLALTGGATSGDYHDPATVAATLTDNGGPVPGAAVSFSLNGSETCTGTTDTSGTASCPVTPGEAAGPYALTASWAGSATDLPASATSTFTVDHEQTTLTYTGATRAANGVPVTLSGVLREDGTTPVAGRTVTFTLGSGATAQSCTGTTDTGGAASCTISDVDQPASTTSVGARAAFAGDGYYSPSSATATLAFEYLTGRAYGLSATGLVTITPVPDTGSVSTASAQDVQPPCVLSLSGPVTAGTLCADVATSLNPGTSHATASVQHVSISALGIPAIDIGAVRSASTTTCSGSTGDASVASVTVGGVPVDVNLHPGANTKVSILGVTLTFNEQIPVTGTDKGLTVNAVHINALGLLNVVIASSTSDIGNC